MILTAGRGTNWALECTQASHRPSSAGSSAIRSVRRLAAFLDGWKVTVWLRLDNGGRRYRPIHYRFRSRARSLGGADRVRSRVRRVARLHFAADTRLVSVDRHRRADRNERDRIHADLDRGGAWRGAG